MVRALLLVAVVLPLASLSLGSTASAQAAPASKASLNQQLDRLNQQADQLVENYLQAKNLLASTRTDMTQLQGRANQAQRDYNQLQAAVSAQWTAAYVRGTGTDIASLLGASDPTVALQRMQSLELLAQRDAQTVIDLQAAKRSYQSTRATLVAAEKKQAATVARLAAERAKVDAAVARTRALLRRMTPTQLAQATGGSGSGSAPPPNVPAPSGSAGKVIAWAKAHLGAPYQYGGDGPVTFDCSGYTMRAWQQAGKSLPHSSAQQYSVTRRISRSQLQPGDLVFYYSPVSHVSIYLGGGMRIGETHTGSTARIQPLGDSITGYGRVM
jgi:peptidoglycan DL-endopeptidase CwlO